MTQRQDQQKRSMCDAAGITLIVIPYWWNKKMETVAQTIQLARPDIVLPTHLLTGSAISTTEIPQQREEKGNEGIQKC